MVALPESLVESERLFPTPDADVQRDAKRAWILNFVPRGDVGAEVGAGRGHFSELLLKYLKPRRAFFVDAWTLRPPALRPGCVVGEIARREAEWRTERFPEVERHFVEAIFPAGADQVAEPLDWLYLDPTNDLETAIAELEAAAALLKPKGILFGDGWWPDPASPRHAVFQAVGKFTRMGRFELVACGPYGQWAMRRRGPWRIKPAAEAQA